MVVDEESDRALYRRLEDVLGAPDATRLMERLPQVLWAEVATKADLRELETRLAHRFEAMLHKEMATVHKEMGALKMEFLKMAHTLFFSMAGLVFTAASLAFAAVRFGG
jgi:hypothetical protein